MRSNFVLFAGLLLAGIAGIARAQPANDAWANRIVIPSLPFTLSEPQAGLATMDPSDPEPPCRGQGSNPLQFSLWYSFTTGAQVEYLNASINGDDIFGLVAIYTGTPGNFRLVSGGCGKRGSSSAFPPRFVGIRLEPGTTYSILAGSQFSVPPTQAFVLNAAAAPRLLVTKTADTRDGTCDADCSLREAIDAANAGAAVVLVPTGSYAITRAGRNENGNDTGDFDLRVSMGIYGAGGNRPSISASDLDRVFDLEPDGNSSNDYPTFALGELVLRDGLVFGSAFQRDGGNLRQLGGTQFFGVDRVLVLGGNAQEAGGGLYFEGPGTVRRATIVSNESGFLGGGVSALAMPNRVEIEDSAIVDNLSLQGGGVHGSTEMLVSNSTISGNRASLFGGGIYVPGGRLVLASSTVVDNIAGQPDGGGGLYLGVPTLAPTHAISNSIIARNAIGEGGDASPDCFADSQAAARSYNVIRSGGSCGPVGTGDVTGVDAGVSTQRAGNGSTTSTFALLLGSPALDAGDPAGCRDATGLLLATDQRGAGFPRVVNGRCDIGALESPLTLPPGIPQLDPASDTGVSNTDHITSNRTPRFTGSCQNGTSVLLRWIGGLAPFVPCVAGVYDVTPGMQVTGGPVPFTAEASGPGGMSLATSATLVVIDFTAPDAPIVTGPAGAAPGVVTITGTASEAGQVTVRESATPLCIANPADVGPWQCAATLATGAHIVTAIETDLAGNTGPVSAPFTITLQDAIFANSFE